MLSRHRSHADGEQRKESGRIVFHENEIEHIRPGGMSGLILTGYYFPMQWREFVTRWPDGSWRMPLIHPRAPPTLGPPEPLDIR